MVWDDLRAVDTGTSTVQGDDGSISVPLPCKSRYARTLNRSAFFVHHAGNVENLKRIAIGNRSLSHNSADG